MGKKALITLAFLFSLTVASAFESVEQALLSNQFNAVMPNFESVGVVIDPSSSDNRAVVAAYKAFSSFYTPTWYEKFVDPTVIGQINRLYDQFLSENLSFPFVIAESKSNTVLLYLPETKSRVELVIEEKEGISKIIVMRLY